MISQIKQNINIAISKVSYSLMLEFTNAQIESLTRLFNDLLIVRFEFFTQQTLQSFIETQNQTLFFLSIVEIVKFIRQLRFEEVDYCDFEYEKKTTKT